MIKNYLIDRKISEEAQAYFGIYGDINNRIVIPINDENGKFLFNKYRRSPLSEEGSKYTYDKGGKVTLYGYDKFKDCNNIIICEGELEVAMLWSYRIPAISSTGGALSFQENWAEFFKDKEVILSFDNDKAGGEGMVKVLEYIPHAKILFIPDIPNIKDLSNYAMIGGNLHELIRTARGFLDIAEVKEDRIKRVAYFQSVHFHDAYIKKHTKINTYVGDNKRTWSNDKVTNARGYLIPELLEFDIKGKAVCPFHNEKTGSLHYYKKTNTCYCFGGCGRAYDVIDIYRQINNCSFTEAVKFLNK